MNAIRIGRKKRGIVLVTARPSLQLAVEKVAEELTCALIGRVRISSAGNFFPGRTDIDLNRGAALA